MCGVCISLRCVAFGLILLSILRLELVSFSVGFHRCCCSSLSGMKEKFVESALPKAGGNVLVLRGEHKGSVGKLLQRNSDTSQGLVQLESDMNAVVFAFDDLAEYVN